MKIEQVNIDAITPYVNNVNIHTDEQIDQIVESIQEFGFLDPVGVWTTQDGTLEIVEGHGRVLAARKLGIDEVPIIKLDNLTDNQRKAYAILHNQLTRNSEFDLDKLAEELNAIDDIELSFDWADFDLEQVDIEFADFDGEGDGGGSQMSRGTKVRVVIGALMFDIDDSTHEIYDKTRELDPDIVAAFLSDAILHDRITA